MKTDIDFKWTYPDLYLRYDLETQDDVFHIEYEIDPNKLTQSTLKRLWAYVLVNEWTVQENESWFESGYGYDVYEETYFILLDKGQQGDFEAKRHLLYRLMDNASQDAYETAQLVDIHYDSILELASEVAE